MHSPLFIQKLFRHKLFLAFIFFLVSSAVTAQPQPYTAANAHSHNDYVQATPFWLAWKAGFGSIEADIFLEGDELLVAHDTAALKKRHALEKLYLQPLDSCIKTNNGYVYPGKRPLILLVDIKTEAVATLNKLVAVLQHYPALIHSPSLLITISGNRPDPATYTNWPGWIYFDGELVKTYPAEAYARIPMVSGNFKTFSKWTGINTLPAADSTILENTIRQWHSLGKRTRFWNAPDTPNSWKTLVALGADFINTDHIPELSEFFQRQSAK